MPRDEISTSTLADDVPRQTAHSQLDEDQLRVAHEAAYMAGKAAMQQLTGVSSAAAGNAVAEAVVAAWHLAVARLSSAAAPSTPGL